MTDDDGGENPLSVGVKTVKQIYVEINGKEFPLANVIDLLELSEGSDSFNPIAPVGLDASIAHELTEIGWFKKTASGSNYRDPDVDVDEKTEELTDKWHEKKGEVYG